MSPWTAGSGGYRSMTGVVDRQPVRRILMTADTVGGVWTYALELCRALPSVEVILATMGVPATAEQRRSARALRNVELCESTYKLEWMPDCWSDVDRAGDWLMGLAEDYEPDLVHLNGYCHGALPWRQPVVVVAHSCVLSWWRAVRGEDAPARAGGTGRAGEEGGCWHEYWHRVRAGIMLADLVIAPTRAMLCAVARHYGRPPQTRVIPNGRDGSRLGAAAAEPFILAAGRVWDPAKNIAALAGCSRRLPWPVYVAGPAHEPGAPAGAEGAAELDGSALHRLGPLSPEALASWLARAAIYALPARYEPFGFSALEAALSGCALVLGDVPSLREVWGPAALYVAPDDPEALAVTLLRLIADESLRARMARMAYQRGRRYTPERMASAYLDAYGALMGWRAVRRARSA